MLRPYIHRAGSPMTDRRWETRLLALLAAVLVVFGLTAVYGASSLLTTAGGQVGSAFALRQALGALVGGVAATLLARSDYRRWRRYAWPVLGAATVLLVIPLLPFTHRVAPTLNGARRWVDLGFVTLQPSELAKFAVVVWTAMLAAKKGEQIRTFRNGLLPFLVILAPLVGLIFLEPNLSMALLVAILAGVVLFTAGARIGHFLLVAVIAAPLVFGGRALRAAARGRAHRAGRRHRGAPHRREPGAAAGDRDHVAIHLVRTLEPARRARRDRRADQRGAGAAQDERGGMKQAQSEQR